MSETNFRDFHRVLREIADPDNRLPRVELEFEPGASHGGNGRPLYEKYLVRQDGRRLGQLKTRTWGENTDFEEVMIYNSEDMGKGNGTSMYLAVAAMAYARSELFHASVQRSPEAIRVWDRFQRQGLAKENTVRDINDDGFSTVIGRVQFIRPQELFELHRQVRGDVETERISGRLAVQGFEATQGGDHRAIVGAKLDVGILDDSFWDSI